MNEYALQQLPLRRLHQQLKSGKDDEQKCSLCGEQVPLFAWCCDCDANICRSCVALIAQEDSDLAKVSSRGEEI